MIPDPDHTQDNHLTVEPFLLDYASKAFLAGDHRVLWDRFRLERDRILFILAGCALLILFPSLVLQVVALTRPTVPQPSLPYLGGTVALTIACVHFLIWKVKSVIARERLVHKGKVLSGRIVRCSGSMRVVAGEDGASDRAYFVTIEYRFLSPQGREIMSECERDREDLLNLPLPVEGTAVLVLYLDDNNYALL